MRHVQLCVCAGFSTQDLMCQRNNARNEGSIRRASRFRFFRFRSRFSRFFRFFRFERSTSNFRAGRRRPSHTTVLRSRTHD